MKFAFWSLIVDFLILMWIGTCRQHPEEPFVTIGQLATGFYFAWFLVLVPFIGLVENYIFDVATETHSSINNTSEG